MDTNVLQTKNNVDNPIKGFTSVTSTFQWDAEEHMASGRNHAGTLKVTKS